MTRGINLNTVLILGGIFFVLYLFRKTAEVTEPIAKTIADIIFAVRSPDAVQVLPQVRLPDGLIIPVQAIIEAGGSINARGIFTWRNVMYQISGREGTVYQAKRLLT